MLSASRRHSRETTDTLVETMEEAEHLQVSKQVNHRERAIKAKRLLFPPKVCAWNPGCDKESHKRHISMSPVVGHPEMLMGRNLIGNRSKLSPDIVHGAAPKHCASVAATCPTFHTSMDPLVLQVISRGYRITTRTGMAVFGEMKVQYQQQRGHAHRTSQKYPNLV